MNRDRLKSAWKAFSEGLRAVKGALAERLGRLAPEAPSRQGQGVWARLCPERLREAMARRGWAPPGRVLGLEVDGDQVFAVELARRGGRVVLERAEELTLPGAAGSAAGPEPDGGKRAGRGGLGPEAARRLAEELLRLGFRARDLATVISRERTFERTVFLPPASVEELEAMAALKSEQELPLALEEAYVDYLFPTPAAASRAGQPSGPARQPGRLVTLCAVPRQEADAVAAAWAEAGLHLRALTVAGHGAWRALRPLWAGDCRSGGGGGRPQAETVCLVLVRHDATELVIGGDTPLFTRAVVPGGSALDWDSPEAVERLTAEVVRSLRAFTAEFPGEQVKRVVLVSRYPVDGRALERGVGLPVEAPREVPCAGLGVEVSAGTGLGAAFASALGAAWEELTGQWERVNFLAPRQERRREAERYRRIRWAAAGAAAAALAVMVPVVVLGARAARLALVERELAALAPQVRELEALKKQLELVRPWVKDRELALEVLAEASEAATAEVYLRTASVNEEGAVVLEGFAKGPRGAYDLRDRLSARSKLLADVTYRSGRSGKDPQFSHQFTLTAQVRRWSVGPRRGGRR